MRPNPSSHGDFSNAAWPSVGGANYKTNRLAKRLVLGHAARVLRPNPMSKTNPKQPESTPPPDDHEEFVHEDDTVIGHALKWSAIAAVFLVVAGFVAYLSLIHI